MEKEEIASAVNELLIHEFEINEKEIHPGARLKDDLGLESLDFVDIAVMVKKRFGINVRGKDMLSVITLGDVYDFLYSRTKDK